MAWIKFEKDLLTDPRVLRIAKALDARHLVINKIEAIADDSEAVVRNAEALPAVTLVCGGLVRLWCLADTHVDENDVLPLGRKDIDKLLGIDGFCSLLPADWLYPIDEDSVKLPNFHAHNGTEAKRKAVTQKRVAAFRSRHAKALPRRNAQALPDQDLDQDLDQKNKNTVGQRKPDALAVLEFLNEKTGRNYEPVPANLELILARLKEGASVEDLRAVVAKKCREWSGDEKMSPYLRPATLFNRTKFAQYVGELGAQEVS